MLVYFAKAFTDEMHFIGLKDEGQDENNKAPPFINRKLKTISRDSNEEESSSSSEEDEECK